MDVNADRLVPLPLHDERLPPACAAAHPVTIGVGRRCTQIRLSSATAAENLARRYRHLLSQNAPELVAYAVERRPGEVVFWVPGRAAYVWNESVLAPNAFAFLADAFLMTMTLVGFDDWIALHAAALGDGRGVAAIVGPSGAGKTTTALAALRHGLALYSDECCIVGARGVEPFPRTLNLREGGLRLLSADRLGTSSLDRWLCGREPGEYEDVGFDELVRNWRQPEPRPLRALFAIEGHGREARFELLPAAAMLGYVQPWSRMQQTGVAATTRLLEFMQGVACFRLRLGRPDDTARMIAGELAALRTQVAS